MSAEPDDIPPSSMGSKPTPGASHAATHRQRGGWHLPRAAYYGLVTAALLLMGLTVWQAQRQLPHPDMLRDIQPWDMGRLDWWAYPRELNAFKRRVISGELEAVFALPGSQHVWIAGQDGLILHSADAGRHWEQQNPAPAQRPAPTESRVGLLADLIPSAHADASKNPQAQTSQKQAEPGDDPKAIASREQRLQAAGAPLPTGNKDPKAPDTSNAASSPQVGPIRSLTQIPIPGLLQAPDANELAALQALHFVDAQRGWAVGRTRGRVAAMLQTQDGGQKWRRVPLPPGALGLLAVSFDAQGLHGRAGGLNGTVLVTDDGGNTWKLAAPYEEVDWCNVLVSPSGDTTWLVGNRRSDFGVAVSRLSAGQAAAAAVKGLPEYTAARGALHPGSGKLWLAFDGGELLESDGTLDAGAWRRLGSKIDKIGSVADLAFSADGSQLLAIFDSLLWRLRDLPGKQAWEADKSIPAEDLENISRLTFQGSDVWAVGTSGRLWHKDEKSWRALSLGVKGSLTDVAFRADGLQGWAIGPSNLLATRDGGVNWVPVNNKLRAYPLSGLAVTAKGRALQVFSGPDLLRSVDEGITWTKFSGPPFRESISLLKKASFDASLQRGLVADIEGSLAWTDDGGASWTMLEKPLRQTIQAVARSRSQMWVAGGEGGNLAPLKAAASVSVDNGKGWTSVPMPVLAPRDFDGMSAIATLDDGRVLFATRRGSILHRSADRDAMEVQRLGDGRAIQALKVLPDGQRGWAVGDAGLVLATLDGGRQWTPQVAGTAQTLLGLTVHEDGQRLWAVGNSATLRRSTDGGRTWVEAGVYQRAWPPWAFAALALLTAGLALLVLRVTPGGVVVPPDPAEGASTTLASDQPVADKSHDLLGYRVAVEALSSFIRNQATEPRVTIAVSGEWGSGKSSIMRMLQTELKQAGFRTAWYNAWHQQQEGRPLTALFNSIREQAVPRWFEQPLAALRVRSRLIWARGGVYRAAAVVVALGLAVLAGDLLREDAQGAGQRLAANFRHHVLGEQTLVLDRDSLASLNPFEGVTTKSGGGTLDLAAVAKACAAPEAAKLKPSPPLSPSAFCPVALQLMPTSEWATTSPSIACRVRPPPDTAQELACQFNGADALRPLLTQRLHLGPAEAALVIKSAQVLPPPDLFSWLHSSVVSGLTGLVLLIFTKGISVYGLQLLAPLKTMLGAKAGDEGNKETAGTIQRFREEFCLLCQALDGRLIVFVDDLDRCTPETVNRTLELTNYLVDVGRCFVVIGAALERVKKCVRPPVFMAKADSPEGQKEALDYANDYLRKLIHVELPVPKRGAALHKLLEPRAEAQAQTRTQVRRLLLERLAVGLGLLAFLVAMWMALGVGAKLHNHGTVAVPLLEAAPTAASAVAPSPSSSAPSPSAPSPVAAASAAATGPVGLLDTDEDEGWPRSGWWALAACAAVLTAALSWRRLRRYRAAVAVALGGALREHDSRQFIAALRIWNDLVVAHDPTPRQIKRFYNRARLLAAFETGSDAQVDEAQLVALAALHQAAPGVLADLEKLPFLTDDMMKDLLTGQQATTSDSALLKLWQQHVDVLGRTPSVHELRRFSERVAGLEVR